MKTRRFSVRPATDEDFENLYRIHREAMKPYVEQVWGWDDDVQERRFRHRFGDGSTTQVVLSEGREIGFLRSGDRNGAIFIAQISIAPGYQGRGIGTSLIRDVLSRGLPVPLRVFKVNTRARQLYERLGFVVTGETETHHEMRWEP